MLNDLFALLKEHDLELTDLSEDFVDSFSDIVALRAHEVITTRHAKEILLAIWNTPYLGVADYIIASKMLEEADDSAVEAILRELMDANPKVCQQVRDGKVAALGFFVGQTLKKIKADPTKIRTILDSIFV